MNALTEHEAQARAAELPGWRIADGKLCTEFRFPDFVSAFGFMTSVALVAESTNHHPEWSNVYGTVTVALVTHDSGGITERDFDLARSMQRLAAGTSARQG